MSHVIVLEGYSTPRFAAAKGKTKMKSKFKAAAKKCKGKKIRAFRACMKAALKKKR